MLAPKGTFTKIILPEEDQVSLKSLTQFELFWRRFSSNKLSVVGLIICVTMILLAVFAPLLTPQKPDTLNSSLGFGSHAPSFSDFPWRIFGTTSGLNYSIYTQILYGARISLFVGFAGSFITSLIGTIVGAIAGFFGGWVDTLLSRIIDVFLSIPFLPLLIAVSAIFFHGQNTNPLVVIGLLSIFSWPGVARLVRSSFLSLRELEYTEAARATGVGTMRTIFRHLLPNAVSPIIVVSTLNVAGFILVESALDFLGLGIDFPPVITWGNILSAAQDDLLLGDWWWPLFPGIFLVLTVLAVSFIGDGLRDAIDVRSNNNA